MVELIVKNLKDGEKKITPGYKKQKKRKIGILKGKASYEIVGDFKMTDEELTHVGSKQWT